MTQGPDKTSAVARFRSRPGALAAAVIAVVIVVIVLLVDGNGSGGSSGAGPTGQTGIAGVPTNLPNLDEPSGAGLSNPGSPPPTGSGAAVGGGSSISTGPTGSPAPVTPTSTAPPAPVGPALIPGTILSGVAASGTGEAAVFGAWRGKPVTVLVNYVGTKTWAGASQIDTEGLLGGVPNTVHRVYSVPLIPSDAGASLEDGANGDYDGYFRTLATQLVAAGEGNATIRLGWEMTGDWFVWSGVKHPNEWAGAYRKAVTAMRSVAGAQFTFDYTEALGFGNPEKMYPGDAYVDVVGADVYDNSFAGSYSAQDHDKVWNELLTEQWGLNWLADFASKHGKRISFGEWGESERCDGHGGDDDPDFIQHMYDFFTSHDVAYEAYFNSADSGVCATFALDSGKFPLAAQRYKQLFGGSTAAAASVAPVPSAAGAPPSS